jgi:hypothetical protein
LNPTKRQFGEANQGSDKPFWANFAQNATGLVGRPVCKNTEKSPEKLRKSSLGAWVVSRDAAFWAFFA